MSVHDLAARRAVHTEVVSMLTPIAERFSGTAKALVAALGLVRAFDIPERVHVHVHDSGRCITLDLTHCLHPAREMRYLSNALGLVLEELAAETADGCAAVELRCSRYEDGILLTCRAVVPVPATWSTR